MTDESLEERHHLRRARRNEPDRREHELGTLSLGQCGELFLEGQFTNEGTVAVGSGIFVNAAFTSTGTVSNLAIFD
jgi:hypothetical protein